jgi:hypothetical protein
LEEKLEALRHVGNLGREVGGQWDIESVLRWDRNSVSLVRLKHDRQRLTS